MFKLRATSADSQPQFWVETKRLPKATARHLEPVNQAIKAEVLQATELQIDETPVEYLKPGHGCTKTGYLWLYNDPQGGTCYYDWHTGRGHDCLMDFLGHDQETNPLGYTGTIQRDGYSAYVALAARFKTIRLAARLAHIRRKFVVAKSLSPEITLPVLLLIGRIYWNERQTRQTKAPPACRELIRRARVRPLADELFTLIHAAHKNRQLNPGPLRRRSPRPEAGSRLTSIPPDKHRRVGFTTLTSHGPAIPWLWSGRHHGHKLPHPHDECFRKSRGRFSENPRTRN